MAITFACLYTAIVCSATDVLTSESSAVIMQRSFLYALAISPALAWNQPRFGYVPGNEFGVPQNASFDYVVVGGGVSEKTP